MKTNQLHLINLLKLISIFAIITLHLNEFLFYLDSNPLNDASFIYPVIANISRYIPFSGHTIIFIIFFTWGLKKKRVKSPLVFVGILCLVHALLNLPFIQWSENIFEQFEWDIYPFIIISYFVVVLLDRIKRLSLSIILFSIFFLSIPTHYFQDSFNLFILKNIFVGNCKEGFAGAWPLIPWIFLPILAYFCAPVIKEQKSFKKVEILFWLPALILGYTQFGLVYDTPIGPEFYCYMLNVPPVTMWGNFIFTLFIIRLSVLDSLQHYLNKSSTVKFVSNLSWSKHFGFCYITHLFILITLSFFKDIAQTPIVFDLIALLIFPITEIIVSYIKKDGYNNPSF